MSTTITIEDAEKLGFTFKNERSFDSNKVIIREYRKEIGNCFGSRHERYIEGVIDIHDEYFSGFSLFTKVKSNKILEISTHDHTSGSLVPYALGFFDLNIETIEDLENIIKYTKY